MVIRRDGKTKDMWFPKTASLYFSTNSFVKMSSTGFLVPSLAVDSTILGVYEGPTIASSDSTTSLQKVTVPVERGVEWTVDVTAGTLAVTSIGQPFALQDGWGVNQGSTTSPVSPVTCTGFISTSKGIFVITPVL